MLFFKYFEAKVMIKTEKTKDERILRFSRLYLQLCNFYLTIWISFLYFAQNSNNVHELHEFSLTIFLFVLICLIHGPIKNKRK